MWKNFTIVLLLISFLGLAWSSFIPSSTIPVRTCPGDMPRLTTGQCAPTTEPPFDPDSY
uniref:Chemokine isoform 1 n=1 Tax=Mythimna separata TaxID=271217 RepID=B7XBB0_MYTSE|nr:chemokine isoform 1 [Mythimna separata]